MMAGTEFYLGRLFDAKSGKLSGKPLEYDPADLTTHAVVTGMTGSGKTGLCIALLEEAALQGIPSIIIDPKGDLTNLLLHFPDLAPRDFQPWIDPEMARRAGKSLDQAAEEAANAWRNGLEEWGIDKKNLTALQNAVQFAIYTPGSDSGIPVSVLSSLASPKLEWETNKEMLREKISSTVTALLGLVGMQDIDPIRSREHILLSNIFEDHWSKGRDVDLTELILQTQNPPFDKLGAFPTDTFFPPNERMELAMVLNNILAAPAFESWRVGDPLDVQALLFTKDKRPRHSVFYLAHLAETERMFFVTLLFSAVETWMRTQSGSTSLRALLYMDEIYGYLPPIANPPSKGPLLRMLKQARAFGLGLLLATQNPVDVDYKGLSNAGTWFIGKLQTDQDKQRLLDGLESLTSGVSRVAMDKLISSLGKRVFIMHNVHEKSPVVFQSRWVMNFLAGPLTLTHIPMLNKLVHAKAASNIQSKPAQPPQAISTSDSSKDTGQPPAPFSSSESNLTKPSLPAGIREYFLPQTNSLPEAFQSAGRSMPAEAMIQSVIYRPALLASAQIRILDRKLGVDAEITRAALVESLDRRGVVRWEEHDYKGPSLDKVETAPAASARFTTVDPPLNDTKIMGALQKDFTDWVYRNSSVAARANTVLKVFAGPEISQADFMKACADAARDARDAEVTKKVGALDKKIQALESKLSREERELSEDQSELQNRRLESGANLLELGAGLVGFGRKKSVSTQFTKHRLAQSARADVQESEEAISEYKKQLADLQRQREEMLSEINDRWGQVVNDVTEVTVNPKKSDVYVNLFGVAWKPYYLVQAGSEGIELPAFGAG